MSKPEENIYVGRAISSRCSEAQTFTMFGATLNNAQLPFGADQSFSLRRSQKPVGCRISAPIRQEVFSFGSVASGR